MIVPRASVRFLIEKLLHPTWVRRDDARTPMIEPHHIIWEKSVSRVLDPSPSSEW